MTVQCRRSLEAALVHLICPSDSRLPIPLLPRLRFMLRVHIVVIAAFYRILRLLHLLRLFALFPHQNLLGLQPLYLSFLVRPFLFLLRFLLVLALLLSKFLLLLRFLFLVRLFFFCFFPLFLCFLYLIGGLLFFSVFFEFFFGFREPFFDDWIPTVPASTTSVSTCTMSQILDAQRPVGPGNAEIQPGSETYP